MSLHIIILALIFAVSLAYKRLSPPSIFVGSQGKCKLKHSNLATMTSDIDLSNGQANCELENAQESCWIGLFRHGPSYEWEWADGNPLSYGFNNGIPQNNEYGKPWVDPDANPPAGNCVLLDKNNEYRWNFVDCLDTAFPLCNLRKHEFKSDCSDIPAGGCSPYKSPWTLTTDGDYVNPQYHSNGVVVALGGALQWPRYSPNAMGTGTPTANEMFDILRPYDCPYFNQEFSVTNVNGIDCVIRVELTKVNDVTTKCTVKLSSWSTPIVYVKSGETGLYQDKSWFVQNVEGITVGSHPNIVPNLFSYLDAPDGEVSGSSNGKTLNDYSWVDFDGIVWICQGSNLAGAGMLPPVYQPEKQPEAEPVSFEHKNKFTKWVVYDNSLIVTVLLVVVGCSFFGLCTGIGIRLTSLRMNKRYYQKLVQSEIDSA